MRCFVAVDLPPETKRKLGRLIQELRKHFGDLKWVEPENLHITLKFLGEVPEAKLQAVERTLTETVRGFGPFTLRLGELGYFGSERDLRVLWLAVEEGVDPLKELAERVEAAMERIGFAREKRAFQAHLTLARARRGRRTPFRPRTVPSELQRQKIPVREVILFQSILRPEGPIYRKLRAFSLQ